MTFLPIVERELRVAARRRSTYRMRLAAALVAMFIGGWQMLMMSTAGFRSNPGQILFIYLVGLAMAYCWLGGILKTADCLSEEKREGTLGLLFLTDLKGHDVVLGKMVATSLSWLYGLFAAFPVMAIALLVGGVTGGEFWRQILVLINMLFVSLSAGMLVSTISRNERKAAVGTILLLILWHNVPSWLGEWHQWATDARDVSPWFLVVNPGHAHGKAWDWGYTVSAGEYWASLTISHLTGWLMLGLASRLLPRVWQDKVVAARPAGRWRRWHIWLRGSAAVRATVRARLLDNNPFYWLAGHDRRKPLLVWVAWGGAMSWIAWSYATEDPLSFILPAYFWHLALKIWVVWEACRRFVDDRRSGALEVLLCTPLSVPQILRGQWLALTRQFGGPIVASLLIDALLFWGTWVRAATMPLEAQVAFLLGFVAAAVIFMADVVALSCLGIWLGLKSASATRVAYGAWLLIMVFPWVLFYGAVMVVMTALMNVQTAGARGATVVVKTVGKFQPTPEFFVGLWFTLSALIALAFGLWAWRRLQRDFRSVAVQRFEARPSWFERRKARRTRLSGDVPPVIGS